MTNLLKLASHLQYQNSCISFLNKTGNTFWHLYLQWFEGSNPIIGSVSIKAPDTQGNDLLKLKRLYSFSIADVGDMPNTGDLSQFTTWNKRYRSVVGAQSLVHHLVASIIFEAEFNQMLNFNFGSKYARFFDMVPDDILNEEDSAALDFIADSLDSSSDSYNAIFSAQSLSCIRRMKGY